MENVFDSKGNLVGKVWRTPYGWFAAPRNSPMQCIPCDSLLAVAMYTCCLLGEPSPAFQEVGGPTKMQKNLTIPERHQLRIAKDTLKMTPVMAAILGGPSIEQAKEIIKRLRGRK